MDHELILKQGLLWKRGRKKLSSWKRRYFLLRPSTLSYHLVHAQKSDPLRRTMELTQQTQLLAMSSMHPFAIQIRTPGFRKITVRLDSHEDFLSWYFALEDAIKHAPAWTLIKVGLVGEFADLFSQFLSEAKFQTASSESPQHQGGTEVVLEYEKEWVRLVIYDQAPLPIVDLVMLSFVDAISLHHLDILYAKERAHYITNTNNPTVPALLVGTGVPYNHAVDFAQQIGLKGFVLPEPGNLEHVFLTAAKIVMDQPVQFASKPVQESMGKEHHEEEAEDDDDDDEGSVIGVEVSDQEEDHAQQQLAQIDFNSADNSLYTAKAVESHHHFKFRTKKMEKIEEEMSEVVDFLAAHTLLVQDQLLGMRQEKSRLTRVLMKDAPKSELSYLDELRAKKRAPKSSSTKSVLQKKSSNHIKY